MNEDKGEGKFSLCLKERRDRRTDRQKDRQSEREAGREMSTGRDWM